MIDRIVFAVVFAVGLGCSGDAKKLTGPSPGQAADGGNGATVDGGMSATPPGDPLTVEECGALIRHIVTLQHSELEAAKPANKRLEQQDSKAAVEEVVAEIVGDPAQLARCQQQPHRVLDCTLKARTTKEIRACNADPGAASAG